MFQQAAISSNPRRIQIARTKSLPAPVGGWNDRDSLAAMPEQDAVILDNFWPLPSKVVVRKGYSNWKTSFAAKIESLMAYQPQTGTAKLFAAAGTAFYDATASGAVGAAVVSGLTNARWQHTNVATSGGNFLMAVNGADKLRGWNGSAWWVDGDASHDITGVDTATCNFITTFKRRVWLVQKATASAWYLPTDSIAGAASKLDFGPIFNHGGYLVAIANWTFDGGDGPDDYSAFIGSNGDVAVYRGTDPASATTWAIVGVFWIGSPVGTRCVTQYRGDVAIISQDGVYPLSQTLLMNRTSTAVAFTDKIQNTVSASISLYGSNFGWQIIPYPGQNMLLINVPVNTGNQQQYVMNTITGAWARFKGWAANCFEIFGNNLYFGGASAVCLAWNTKNDGGVNINAEGLQAFNYFDNRDSLKEWTLVRPVLAVSSKSGFYYGLNVDFDTTAPSGVPSFAGFTATQWGPPHKGWGKPWGGSPKIQKGWQGAAGTGYCAALHILASVGGGEVQWLATDYAYKAGGIL